MVLNEWVARTLVAVEFHTYTGVQVGTLTVTLYRNALAGYDREWTWCDPQGRWHRGKGWDQASAMLRRLWHAAERAA